MLKIHIPRFVEGEGSLVTIDAVTNPRPNNTAEDYSVYTTYDVGSSKLVTHIVSNYPQNPLITIDKQTSTFQSKYGYGLTYIAIAISILIAWLLYWKREEIIMLWKKQKNKRNSLLGKLVKLRTMLPLRNQSS
jgi:hypothetical protein